MYSIKINGIEYCCPDEVRSNIERYVKTGDISSAFLTAVLENDLLGALTKADSNNFKNLPGIVSYCYWEIPSVCWGSKDKVNSWIEKCALNSKANKKDVKQWEEKNQQPSNP